MSDDNALIIIVFECSNFLKSVLLKSHKNKIMFTGVEYIIGNHNNEIVPK